MLLLNIEIYKEKIWSKLVKCSDKYPLKLLKKDKLTIKKEKDKKNTKK